MEDPAGQASGAAGAVRVLGDDLAVGDAGCAAGAPAPLAEGLDLQLVNDKVSSGLYQTASEVVREALRLLRTATRSANTFAPTSRPGSASPPAARAGASTKRPGAAACRTNQSRWASAHEEALMSYRLSPLAEQDLQEIWSHVADDANPERADRLTDAIFRRFDMLADFPRTVGFARARSSRASRSGRSLVAAGRRAGIGSDREDSKVPFNASVGTAS